MEDDIARKYDNIMDNITGIEKSDRQRYLSWFGQQDEAIIVLVMQAQSKRYLVYKEHYPYSRYKKVMFASAIIEAAALYCEADGDQTDINWNKVWYTRNELRHATESLHVMQEQIEVRDGHK